MHQVMECFRKVLLVGVFVFVVQGDLTQLIGGCFASLTFVILYNNVKPYGER